MLKRVYRHYARRGKMVRIRFIHDRSSEDLSSLPTNQTKALLEPAGIVLKSGDLNVLIVYAHDTPEHDAAVLALADFLRQVFHFDVHLDVYDAEQIEKNLMDYLSSSIINADKIPRPKIQAISGGGFVVENNEPTAFDALFTSQIDMVLQHHSVVSVRFDYAQFEDVVHPLQGSLQYVLPANLTPLLCALTGTNLKGDPRLSGYSPEAERLTAAIERQRARIAADPVGWFAATHHRRARTAAQPSLLPASSVLPTLPALVPSMSTLPTESIGGDDFAEDQREVDSGDLDLQSGAHVRVESVNELEDDDDRQLLLQHRKRPKKACICRLLLRRRGYPPSNRRSSKCRSKSPPSPSRRPRRSVDFEPADSGVYDETTMLTSDSLEQAEDEEDGEQFAHQPAGLTRLPPAKQKWQRQEDEQMDSGLVSDVDLHMISAS
ncbi:SEFIR domain-containing protein [Aphelenchoides fujianensis]|nr:SEFIR domain-containing protein [Aphelenchoides fujianensis]